MKYIASRKLLFSEKGSHITKEMVVRIGEPFIVDQATVSFPVDGVISGCRVELEGLDEPEFDLYGMDSLQAVSLAANIEPFLERLSGKYDFFWITGEPYFEE
jgi:hypothetical protein